MSAPSSAPSGLRSLPNIAAADLPGRAKWRSALEGDPRAAALRGLQAQELVESTFTAQVGDSEG